MDSREFAGVDLDEALGAASAALGVPAEELAWELVEEGRKGVFGLGARQVRVRVTAIEGARPAPPPPIVPETEEPIAAASAPEGLLTTANRMLSLMGLRSRAAATPHASGWTVRIEGPDLKALLRNDGEVLEAMEFLLQRMGRRAWPEAGPVRIECEGFRDRRDEDLVELARAKARTVARTGRSEVLDELNPYERRLVHLAVRETPGVVSRSEGEGFLKRVHVERGPA